jgi:hypothetical protein
MLLNKNAILITLTLLSVSGCISTENQAQQTKITNLKDSLVTSQSEATKTLSQLESANSALAISADKINTLTVALENSQKLAKTAKLIKQQKPNKITHLDDKTILGQSEWVYISTSKKNYKGRIDTGAATSSINALNIKRFERDGEKWVRFNITHDKNEKAQIIEAKIVRVVKIIQSSTSKNQKERPVIQLYVRIGDVAHLTDFTLTNRQHMDYPVLIGRTFMQDIILVDVSKEYIYPKYQTSTKK